MPMFPFYTRIQKYRKRTSARNRFRQFFFLSTNIENISIYLEDDQQTELILPAKSSRNGRSLFPRWKTLDQYFTLYHIPFTEKSFSIYFTFDNKECVTSLMKSMNKFHYSKLSTSKQAFLNFLNVQRKTPVLESLINKVAGQNACQFIKKRL